MANLRTRRRWDLRRAMRAINRLFADPDDTAIVFEIIEALPGRAQEKAFHRFSKTETGRRILIEQRQLIQTLNDRAYLRSLPEDSLGGAYLRFVEAEQLSADGLVQASLDGTTNREEREPEFRLFGERLRDMHDLWHVVTGYGRDTRGEAALLAFSFAQVHTPGVGLIVAMVYKSTTPETRRLIREGWKKGRRVQWFPAADWEALLEKPLEEVRARLDVGELPAYEPTWSSGAPAAAQAA